MSTTEQGIAGRAMDREVAWRLLGHAVVAGGGYAHDFSYADYPAVQVPHFSTNAGDAWVLAQWMKEHGSSFTLNWGEDNDLWECSWITGGERHSGFSKHVALAICQAALSATK